MGGLIIAAGFGVALAVLSLPSSGVSATIGDSVGQSGIELIPGTARLILVLFVLFSLIGFVDDYVVPRLLVGKRGLGWKQKIAMQLVAALVYAVPAYSGNATYIGVAVFLVLFFSNAYNFSDGLDGLAGSLLVTLSFGLMGVAAIAGHSEVLPVLMALVGATIPFLVLNAPPAKIFMGDVGSLGIGAVFGATVLMITLPVTTHQVAHFSGPPPGPPIGICLALVVASLMMVVELVPVPLQIASVKLRHKKLFPYTPIHHAFEKAGWPESRVVWLFALCQFVLSALAIQIAVGLSVENGVTLVR